MPTATPFVFPEGKVSLFPELEDGVSGNEMYGAGSAKVTETGDEEVTLAAAESITVLPFISATVAVPKDPVTTIPGVTPGGGVAAKVKTARSSVLFSTLVAVSEKE
jgi:hypothetical protein